MMLGENQFVEHSSGEPRPWPLIQWFTRTPYELNSVGRSSGNWRSWQDRGSTLRSVRIALLFLIASPALAQGVAISVAGGIPVTETIRSYQSAGRFGGYQAESATRRF